MIEEEWEAEKARRDAEAMSRSYVEGFWTEEDKR
jgi:hypothetical protein